MQLISYLVLGMVLVMRERMWLEYINIVQNDGKFIEKNAIIFMTYVIYCVYKGKKLTCFKIISLLYRDLCALALDSKDTK